MDELISDLGNTNKKSGEVPPTVSHKEVSDFLAAKKHGGRKIGLGVFLCIMAPAILLLITQLTEDGVFGNNLLNGAKDVVRLIPFFIILACSVGSIINQHYAAEGFQC